VPSRQWKHNSLWTHGGIEKTAVWGPYGRLQYAWGHTRFGATGMVVTSTCGDSARGTVHCLLTFLFIEQQTLLFFRSGTRHNHIEFISVSQFPKHSSIALTRTSSESCFSFIAGGATLLLCPTCRALELGTIMWHLLLACHFPIDKQQALSFLKVGWVSYQA
jgi:hypothetical protein